MTSGFYTTTRSETFTVTHARHIVIKIATDLKRMQSFYGCPTNKDIKDYEKEAVALLLGDYLESVEYGFQRDGHWVVALKYAARYGGILIADDTPGRIPRGVNVEGCGFASYLRFTSKWDNLPEDQRKQIYVDAEVSFRRTPSNGYQGNWHVDKTYSAGGRGVVRHHAVR